MKLHLHYSAQLRAAVGRSEEQIELPAGSTLADVVTYLLEKYAGARPHLAADSGDIRPSLLVVVNDHAVPQRELTSRVLADDDAVMLLPPIAGG